MKIEPIFSKERTGGSKIDVAAVSGADGENTSWRISARRVSLFGDHSKTKFMIYAMLLRL